MLLADMSWEQVKALDWSRLIVVLPTGSFEQHGPHLPLSVDSDIVTAIAQRLEQRLPEKILLLPTLWPGHSTHHMHFPGTIDVPQLPYIGLITDIILAWISRQLFPWQPNARRNVFIAARDWLVVDRIPPQFHRHRSAAGGDV